MLPFDYITSTNYYVSDSIHYVWDKTITGTIYVDVNGFLMSVTCAEYCEKDIFAK